MLGWLPERLYNKIKDDPEYITLIKLFTSVDNTDIVNRFISEEQLRINNPNALQQEKDIVTRVCVNNPELIRQYNYTYMCEEKPLLDALLTETDLEDKLYIYEILAGVIYRPTKPEGLVYVNKYIEEYEANPDYVFSEKIHEEYFTFKCQIHQSEYFSGTNTKLKFGDMNSFKTYMDGIANGIESKFNNSEYIVKLISHCKVRQTFYFLANSIEIFGPRADINWIIEKETMPSLNSISFEYNNFNYYRFQLIDMICKYYFDRRNAKFYTYLKQCIDMINWSFSNKDQSCKALNYYNDMLITHYLTFVTKYRLLTEVYMPWLDNKYKVDLTKLSDLEKNYTDSLTSATELLTKQFNIALMNPMTTDLCAREMKYVESYLKSNEENYDIFKFIKEQ